MNEQNNPEEKIRKTLRQNKNNMEASK